MPELLAHLIGDYVLQNHAMATKKTSSWWWACLHAIFYGLPFLLLVSAPWQWAVIVGTHALIDRYRLAQYWLRFWGIGCEGEVLRAFAFSRHFGGHPEPWHLQNAWENREEPAPAPPYLAVWLLIIVDNTLHMTINHLVLGAL